MTTENQTSTQAHCWEELPPEIAAKIFTYLPLDDRQNASVTCRTWAEVFKCPILWQRMTCAFYSTPGSETDIPEDRFPSPTCCGESAIGFATAFGKNLRNLWLHGVVVEDFENHTVRNDMSLFFTRLLENECQLKELRLTGYIDCVSCTIFTSLTEFLCSQTDITVARLSWDLPISRGVQLLQALSTHCHDSMKILRMHYCFYFYQPVYRSRDYQDCMKKWTKLEEISVNYDCLDNEVLLCLAGSCGATLQKVSIFRQYWFNDVVGYYAIPGWVWKDAKLLAPNLYVEFVLYVPRFDVLHNIIPKEVPLKWLDYYSIASLDNRSEINICVAYIKESFHKTLERLKLFGYNNSDGSYDSLVELAVACKKLTSLEVRGLLPPSFIETLCHLRETNQIALKIFHVQFLGLTTEQRNFLCDLKIRYQPMILSQNLDYEFHY